MTFVPVAAAVVLIESGASRGLGTRHALTGTPPRAIRTRGSRHGFIWNARLSVRRPRSCHRLVLGTSFAVASAARCSASCLSRSRGALWAASPVSAVARCEGREEAPDSISTTAAATGTNVIATARAWPRRRHRKPATVISSDEDEDRGDRGLGAAPRPGAEEAGSRRRRRSADQWPGCSRPGAHRL